MVSLSRLAITCQIAIKYRILVWILPYALHFCGDFIYQNREKAGFENFSQFLTSPPVRGEVLVLIVCVCLSVCLCVCVSVTVLVGATGT